MTAVVRRLVAVICALAAALIVSVPAHAAFSGAYVRPKGASPLDVSLVPAYEPCTAPNREHGPPLAFPACSPPVPSSTAVTIGEPTVNGATANFVGAFKLKVKVGTPGPPDDSDVLISGSVTDVRCTAGTSACGNANAADGADYIGELLAFVPVRVTDRFNAVSPGGGTDGATMVEVPFPFAFTCVNTASTAEGGLCTANPTSFNASVPGAFKDGKRMIWELGQVRVTDGGPDGDAQTGPNTNFLRQGVFVP